MQNLRFFVFSTAIQYKLRQFKMNRNLRQLKLCRTSQFRSGTGSGPSIVVLHVGRRMKVIFIAFKHRPVRDDTE